MTYYLIYLSISFFITYIVTHPTKKLAKTYSILSQPNSVSNRQVPYLGGIAIYLGFILAFILFCYVKFPDREINISLNNPKFFAIIVGAMAVTFCGLIHDVYPYPVTIRISVQMLSAFVLTYHSMGIDIEALRVYPLHLEENTVIYLGNLLATVLWTLVVIGSLDYMDKIEGMFCNIAVVLSMIFFAFAVLGNHYENALVLSIVAGCLLGIFIEQAKPSKILLGKSGTYFLGFILAAMSMDVSYAQKNITNAVIPLIMFAVPIVHLLIAFSKKEDTVSYFREKGWHDNKQVFWFTLLTCLCGIFSLVLAKVVQ